MFFVGGILLTIIGVTVLFACTFVLISLPLFVPYAWYLHSYGEKHKLPNNFNLGTGFFKFYFQLLRFKRPTF